MKKTRKLWTHIVFAPALALMAYGLSACGGSETEVADNQFARLADELATIAGQPVIEPIYPNDGWTLNKYVPGVVLEGEYHIDGLPAPIDITVLNTDDGQLIRLAQNGKILFEQDMSWTGEIDKLTVGELTTVTALDAELEADKDFQYLKQCSIARDWQCYLEALDVLARLKYSAPDIFPAMNVENAATGLMIISDAIEE